MYAILLKYENEDVFLGVGMYKHNDERLLVLDPPRRKYRTFEQALNAVVAIKNGNYANGNFKDYEIVSV